MNTRSQVNATLFVAFSVLALTLNTLTADAAPIAVGTTIGVDFGPTTPTNFFNQVNPAPAAGGSLAGGSLIDTSGGGVDDVGFSWAANNPFFNNNDSISIAGQPAIFVESNLTDWIGIAASGGPVGVMTLTFTGLNDSFTYDLVIGSGFNSSTTDVLWAADSISATTDSDVGADSYVTLAGLQTDGSGNLVITGTGTPTRTDLVVVSALALTAVAGPTVPEPEAVGLAALGCCLVVGLLATRRRRNLG